MTTEQPTTYWWCLNHHRVESGTNRCGATDLLGPYDTETQAQQAMQEVEQRNRAYDAEEDA